MVAKAAKKKTSSANNIVFKNVNEDEIVIQDKELNEPIKKTKHINTKKMNVNEALDKITKADIKRICQRAGVIRRSSNTNDVIREIMNNELERLLNALSHWVMNDNRITVTKNDVVNTVQFVRGFKMACLSKDETENFSTYIYRTLKEVHPNAILTSEAKEIMNSLVHFFATDLNDTVLSIFASSGNDRKTLQERDVYTACNILLPANMAKIAIINAKLAVKSFKNYKPQTTNRGGNGNGNGNDDENLTPKIISKTIQDKAGILFSVSRFRNMIKEFGAQRMSAPFTVAMTSILQYICTEIFELSGNLTDTDRVTITARHIFLAISNDKELNELFLKKMKVFIPNGGVPTIKEDSIEYNELMHPSRTIQKNKKPKKCKTTSNLIINDNVGVNENENENENENVKKQKKKKRYRLPGTIARRDTRKAIKETGLVVHHEPFDRLTRSIASKTNKKLRFSSGVMNVIQSYIEYLTIICIRDANHQSLLYGHKTIDGKTIRTSYNLAF